MPGSDKCRQHRDDELGRRHAGAPAGNVNARKHGFYGRGQFTEDDLARLALIAAEDGLDDETAFVRLVIADLSQSITEAEGIEERVKLATALFAGAGRVAMLLKTQHVLDAQAADTLAGAIGSALDQLNAIFSEVEL